MYLNEEQISKLKEIMDDLFPNDDKYIVGSSVIRNYTPNDIDVLVVKENPYTPKELREARKSFRARTKGLCDKHIAILFTLKRDNPSRDVIPAYYDFKDGKLKEKDANDADFVEFRERQKAEINKRRLFYKSIKRKSKSEVMQHGKRN